MSSITNLTLLFVPEPPSLVYQTGNTYYDASTLLQTVPPVNAQQISLITPLIEWKSQPVFILLDHGWVIATSDTEHLYLGLMNPKNFAEINRMEVRLIIPFLIPTFQPGADRLFPQNLRPFDQLLLNQLRRLGYQSRPFSDLSIIQREVASPLTIYYDRAGRHLYYRFNNKYFEENPSAQMISWIYDIPTDLIPLVTVPANRAWNSKPLLVLTDSGWVIYTTLNGSLVLEYFSSPDAINGRIVFDQYIPIPDPSNFHYRVLPEFDPNILDMLTQIIDSNLQ